MHSDCGCLSFIATEEAPSELASVNVATPGGKEEVRSELKSSDETEDRLRDGERTLS